MWKGPKDSKGQGKCRRREAAPPQHSLRSHTAFQWVLQTSGKVPKWEFSVTLAPLSVWGRVTSLADCLPCCMSLHEGNADSPQQPGYVAAAGQVTFVFCPTDVGFESSVGTGFASDLLPKASRGEPRGRNALSLLGGSGWWW